MSALRAHGGIPIPRCGAGQDAVRQGAVGLLAVVQPQLCPVVVLRPSRPVPSVRPAALRAQQSPEDRRGHQHGTRHCKAAARVVAGEDGLWGLIEGIVCKREREGRCELAQHARHRGYVAVMGWGLDGRCVQLCPLMEQCPGLCGSQRTSLCRAGHQRDVVGVPSLCAKRAGRGGWDPKREQLGQQPGLDLAQQRGDSRVPARRLWHYESNDDSSS